MFGMECGGLSGNKLTNVVVSEMQVHDFPLATMPRVIHRKVCCIDKGIDSRIHTIPITCLLMSFMWAIAVQQHSLVQLMIGSCWRPYTHILTHSIVTYCCIFIQFTIVVHLFVLLDSISIFLPKSYSKQLMSSITTSSGISKSLDGQI